jgi:hypothetical protein
MDPEPSPQIVIPDEQGIRTIALPLPTGLNAPKLPHFEPLPRMPKDLFLEKLSEYGGLRFRNPRFLKLANPRPFSTEQFWIGFVKDDQNYVRELHAHSLF